MTLRSVVKSLLVLALSLPVVEAVLIWAAGLLTSMGDADGAQVVHHVATGCQVVWAVGLVGLVIVLGLVVSYDERQGSKVENQEPEDAS